MKKSIFIITLLLVITACSEKVYTAKNSLKINATKDNSGNLVGIANKESFTKDVVYKTWFNNRYENYSPNVNAIKTIQNNLKHVSIKAFMGTWCGDSKNLVPKFYKILNQANFNETKMVMIAVNRAKKANGLETELKNGKNRVPTFIFYRNNKEIGRFVERTSHGKTLETMIAEILSK